uniref:Clathrin light chain n=1 Tax=Podarcis muralis TaxID=64176 RepID=A0A670KCE5_PODMU
MPPVYRDSHEGEMPLTEPFGRRLPHSATEKWGRRRRRRKPPARAHYWSAPPPQRRKRGRREGGGWVDHVRRTPPSPPPRRAGWLPVPVPLSAGWWRGAVALGSFPSKRSGEATVLELAGSRRPEVVAESVKRSFLGRSSAPRSRAARLLPLAPSFLPAPPLPPLAPTMAEFDLFSSPQPAAGNGALGGGGGGGGDEDPAAAFLAQQENEIAGIENDEGYSILENGEVPAGMQEGLSADSIDGVTNGDVYQESNGPTDCYAAISQADRLQTEPESIRKWREEQLERLEVLDANSRKQEAEWKEKAIKELEEWYARQDEQLQKTKVNNRAAEEAFVNDVDESSPGTEWERVARLCDFNPKSNVKNCSLWALWRRDFTFSCTEN